MSQPPRFDPLQRSTQEEILRQNRLFEKHVCSSFIQALPGGVFVLNDRREIVYLHPRSAALLGERSVNDCLGLRVGEALGCINARLERTGCQTSKFCAYCGAIKAMEGSERHGEGREECHLIRSVGDHTETLLLDVLAVRIASEEQNYCVFSATNLTETRELKALERFFFHDVLNLAGGVRNMLEILKPKMGDVSPSTMRTLQQATDRLVNEITVQKKISQGKNKELRVEQEYIRAQELAQDLGQLFQAQWPRGPHLEISPNFAPVSLESDRSLLGRVLGNMLKNAAEASTREQTVTIGCERHDNAIRFWVRNEQELPKKIRLQMFRNSFSTKGEGRGLGTHSMKLIGERYLGGKVGFWSDSTSGTVFYLDLPISSNVEPQEAVGASSAAN